MGYFSPYTVPPGKSSIMTEITTPPQGHELSGVSDAVLIERVVQELDQAGVINQRDVIVTDITNMRYGYVVHDVRRMEHLPRIHAWFREVGIDLLGRFGEFDYINTDEVLRRSRALADRINSAKPS
jgi:protoporphyrinogen oxidase